MAILQVRYSTTEKVYEIYDKESNYEIGDQILIESNNIVETAIIKNISTNKDKPENEEEFKGVVIRKVTPDDLQKLDELKRRATEYLPACDEKIQFYCLESMKLLDADLSFDEKKITFYFSAENRVDFRELVADLVRSFKKIIRLQQVGSRDEVKLFGGHGKCGRGLCCSSFLTNVESVTLDMVKEQEIISSSSKLTGACGKLMCCISFEIEEYRKLAQNLPSVGSEVKAAQGKGKVISRSILKQIYTIEKENGERVEVNV